MVDEIVLMPFYLIVGVTADRRPEVDPMILAMRDELATHPTAADHVRWSIIEFADDAQVRLPLGDPLDPAPALIRRALTGEGPAYGAALSALWTAIATDVPALLEQDGVAVRRPLAWLVTDHPPSDSEPVREAALRPLTGSAGYPYIVPVGAGDVPDDALRPLIHPTQGALRMTAVRAEEPAGFGDLGMTLAHVMIDVARRAEAGESDVLVLPGQAELPAGVRLVGPGSSGPGRPAGS